MVKISQLANGVIFDTTGLPGSGEKFAVKKFVPKNYPNILDVQLYNDRIVATDVTGFSYAINLNGSDNAYPVSHIQNEVVLDVNDMFDKFIAIL